MNYATSAETPRFAELARQLAFNCPESMLPCPLCADSLHAEQLDRHITKVHLLAPDKTIDQRSESFTLTGADRNVRATAIAFPFAFIPTMVFLGLLGVFPNKLVPHALAVLVLSTFGLFVVYIRKILPARLTLTDNFIILRYGLLLFRCKLPLTANLQVGSFQVPGNTVFGGDEHSYDWKRGGAYLRIVAGWSSITVGCEQVSGLGRYWNPRAWRQGGDRRRWDITLDPISFATLQYGLAARNILSPRPSARK